MTDPASLIPIPPPPEDDDFAFEANLDFPERYPGLGQLNDLIKKLPPEGQPNLSPNEAPDLASFASRKTLEKAFKNSQSSLNSLEPNAELTTLPQSHDEELGLGDPFNFPADYPKRDQTTTNQETVAETTNKPPIKDENPAAFASLKSPKAPILNSEASSVNSETSSELSSEPSSELNSETSSELNSEASPELNSEPSSELSSEASSEASPELSSEASSELSSEASPELSSEANPELNSEPSFELNSEASFELNSEASSELNSEASPELSLTASSELNSEPSSEPSLTTNSEPSLTTNSEPSPTTSSELNSEASSELNSEASSELNSGAISELNSEASSELNSEAISELNSEASSEASSEAPLGDEGFGPVDTLTFPDDYPKRDQTEATKKLPPENPANLPPIEDTPLYGNRPVRIFEIVNALLERNPNADEDLVNRAYVFAATAHQGATRRSGEPYLIHPLAVAWILTDMRLDATTVAAGLLHDVVEDTKFTKEDIQKEFGEDVAKIVAGVTKIGKLEFKSDTERAAANMRNMILAMLTDPRVILVKLADRLNNMRTLGYMPDDKQKKIAKETLDIFAPLATRLGIQKMQSELEDLSFYYLDSKDYLELRQAILTGRHDRQQYVLEVINFLSARMAEFGVTCEIEGRPKHLYSVWRKMKEQNLPLKQIYDLVAFRVIVADVQACYNVLGLIHSIFRPIPGRFKDYINLPKKNGYRSLHTAVIGLKNVPMEIQIRTKEMHSYAEEGIAAHWLYKEGGELPEDVSERINSLRTLLNWQDNLEDAEIYLESVRDSLAEHDTVIVITPKGDTKELPVGATPLDFAYSIHSEIGHHCSGARVNGQMTSIRQTLSTGDTVEIITSPAARPSRDWARFVVSSKARARIKQYFATTEKNDAEIFGQELIVREMRRLRLKKTRLSKEVLKKLGFETLNDLNLAVAYSRVTIRQVMEAILPDLVNQTPPPPTEPKAAPKDPKDPKAALDGIFVKGVENVFIHYGHCCSPVPGEPIAGFITRGHGVTIHAAKCASLSRLDPERIVEVSWDPTLVPQTTRKIDLKVQFRPTKGGLSKIVSLLADEVSDLVEVNANNSKAGLLFFKVAVKNYSEYENAVQALTSLGGLVERVDRYYPEDNEAPKDEA